MFRRVSQRVATVSSAALVSAAVSAVDVTGLNATALCYNTPCRGFFRIRMVKSPNQPGDESASSSSSAGSSSGASSSTPTVSKQVIQSEDESGQSYDIEWDSKDFYKRLGLTKKCTDKEIRARYIDLAKKFHPDLAGGGKNEYINNLPPNTKPEDVFKNIKEAYEALSNPQTREFIDARGSEEYQERQNQGYGVSPEEFARQQAMKQLFSDGLPFFIASVILFLSVIAYNYRSRMNTGALYTFVVILLVMSFFPRILAAGLMYLMHCNDLLAVFEKEAQAAALVTVTATQSGAAIKTPTAASTKGAAKGTMQTPMDVTIRCEGIDAKHIPEGNLVVVIKKAAAAEKKDEAAAAAAEATPAAAVPAPAAEEEEVFVFAKGVTACTIPLMLPAVGTATSGSGVAKPTWEMSVRFINDKLKLTLMEKTAYL